MKPTRPAFALSALLAAALLFAGGAPALAQDAVPAPDAEGGDGGAHGRFVVLGVYLVEWRKLPVLEKDVGFVHTHG